MNRKKAIGNIALLLGIPLSATTFISLLEGCQAADGEKHQEYFLGATERKKLKAIVESMMAPAAFQGAGDAATNFVDRMLALVATESERDSWQQGLAELDKGAIDIFQQSFQNCRPAEKMELLKERLKHEAKMHTNNPDDPIPFLRQTRRWLIIWLCASEYGAQTLMRYDPVPGSYKGCVSLINNDTAWAVYN